MDHAGWRIICCRNQTKQLGLLFCLCRVKVFVYVCVYGLWQLAQKIDGNKREGWNRDTTVTSYELIFRQATRPTSIQCVENLYISHYRKQKNGSLFRLCVLKMYRRQADKCHLSRHFVRSVHEVPINIIYDSSRVVWKIHIRNNIFDLVVVVPWRLLQPIQQQI